MSNDLFDIKIYINFKDLNVIIPLLKFGTCKYSAAGGPTNKKVKINAI